jgi:DNA-directed RNA polymerase subunit RPC12/RpoP
MVEPSWQLLRRTSDTNLTTLDLTFTDEGEDFTRIRCPLCAWRPSDSNAWSCIWTPGTPEPRFPGCGATWNTFATRGRCPDCGHQWRWTSCLRCGQWSPHDDWYEEDE